MTRDTAPPTGQARSKVPSGRWWPLVAVAGLLGLAAVAAALSQPRLSAIEQPLGEGPGGRRPRPTGTVAQEVVDGAPAAEPAVLPGWLSTALTTACALIIAVLAVVAVWVALRNAARMRRVGPAPAGPDPSAPPAVRAEEVVAAVEAGLDELSDTDRDPRRAVIACWVRLEQAAAAAGTPREVGDTSTDLVVRLLSAHRVDRRVLDAFAAIYRAARYATHAVDEGMREQARAALRQLRAELAVPTGGAS